MSEDLRPACNWPLDAHGIVRIADTVEPVGGCRLPPGLRGFVVGVETVDAHGRPAPDGAEWHRSLQHAKLRPHARPKTALREVPMDDTAPTPTQAPAAAPTAPAALTATVGVPPVPSASDLSRVAADAGGGLTGILMAIIAVVGGGGAVWKYLQSKQKAAAKRDELAHEQRMKELELQADNQRRDDEDRHGECKAARDALAGRVESLEQQGRFAERALSDLRDRLDAVSAKTDRAVESISVGTNNDEQMALATLSKRVSKLETAVKAKQKGTK